ELWYFTNEGIDEATEAALSTTDSEAFTIVSSASGALTGVPAGAIRDSKIRVRRDENISWHEFSIAFPRMVEAMGDGGWSQERVKMFDDFWKSLLDHRWYSSPDEFESQGLLLYQAQQRRLWHISAHNPRRNYMLDILDQDL
ncbi:hypothetical protein BJ138DRAFT_990507, partial [Hygrophoropsis aurantiaca]